MPTNSDLVTDLPADFEVFGQGVDTTLADLKGGTTGQILSKATNADMDFVWTNLNPGDITGVTATSPLTGGGTSGDVTIGIQAASTSQSGAVQLTDSTSSTSTSTAATPNSVKSAYDLANAAIPKSLVDAKGDIISATADNTPSRVAVGNNGEQLLADSTNTSGLRWTATPSASNPLLNSNFSVWQRGTSTTITSGNGYTADRWNAWTFTAGGSVTTSRQATSDTTNLPNIQYCARFQRVAGNTNTGTLAFGQAMETINSIPFAGKTVTISFYARAGANYSSASNGLNFQLWTNTTTDGSLQTVQSGNTTVGALTATLTTTWQRFTTTGTIGATITQIAPAFFYAPTGTAGANDYFEVTGVQIDVGNVALPYRAYGATYQAELAACQRYYYRQTATSSNGNINASGLAFSTTNALLNISVAMRITPSSVDYSGLRLVDGVSASNVSSLIIDPNLSSPTVGCINATTTGLTQYRFYLLGGQSGAGYIGFSAEL